VALGIVATTVGATLAAAPAAATATGTDRAEVTAVEPPAAGEVVALRVLDGDELVELTVRPGHRVEVPGYEGEPWLRFAEDGTLEENVASPAGWLNRSADGDGPVPSEADASAPPVWEPRPERSSVRWHDHRVHDMGEGTGRGPGLLKTWEVALVVDGEPATVQGRLERLAAPSPAPWVLVALVVAGAGTALARPDPVRRAVALALGAATLAGATALAGLTATASADAADVVPLVLAVLGLGGAAATALVLRGRDAATPSTGPGLAVLAAAGLAAGSIGAQAGALVDPVVVSDLADPLVRTALAVAGGAVAAVALVLTWTGLGAAGPPAPASRRGAPA
jgi:hypothetical protein